jgi:hypothetical protein
VFKTEDHALFQFLASRHKSWRVRLERGVYVASFPDSPQLRRDIEDFKRNPNQIRSLDELAAILIR